MLDIDRIEKELTAKTFISRVYYFEELSSTNDFAKSVTEADNVLVITDNQIAGRGRFERKWVTEKSRNLTFTIRKHFTLDLENSGYVNFFFTYLLFSSIKSFIERHFPGLNTEPLEIKWPNDILLDSKKICGILIESISNGREYLIGTGINVNQNNFGSILTAGSLSAYTGTEIDRSSLLIHIVKVINANLHLIETREFNRIYELWKSSTKMIGKYIDIEHKGLTFKSVQIIDLPADGTIELFINDSKKCFTSGEISILAIEA